MIIFTSWESVDRVCYIATFSNIIKLSLQQFDFLRLFCYNCIFLMEGPYMLLWLILNHLWLVLELFSHLGDLVTLPFYYNFKLFSLFLALKRNLLRANTRRHLLRFLNRNSQSRLRILIWRSLWWKVAQRWSGVSLSHLTVKGESGFLIWGVRKHQLWHYSRRAWVLLFVVDSRILFQLLGPLCLCTWLYSIKTTISRTQIVSIVDIYAVFEKVRLIILI